MGRDPVWVPIRRQNRRHFEPTTIENGSFNSSLSDNECRSFFFSLMTWESTFLMEGATSISTTLKTRQQNYRRQQPCKTSNSNTTPWRDKDRHAGVRGQKTQKLMIPHVKNLRDTNKIDSTSATLLTIAALLTIALNPKKTSNNVTIPIVWH